MAVDGGIQIALWCGQIRLFGHKSGSGFNANGGPNYRANKNSKFISWPQFDAKNFDKSR
jgi:hypothetical protein